MLGAALQQRITSILLSATGKEHQLVSALPVSGGCINDAFKIQTDKGIFFVKVNSADKFPGMFSAEAKGLDLLRKQPDLYIPGVYGTSEDADGAVFLAEFVSAGARARHFFYEFGRALAQLHGHTQRQFGLDHDNYIGSLKQANSQRTSWSEFFSEMRLEVQLKLVRDNGRLSRSLTRAFENLYKNLDEIFPAEPPALLHGDLWSGNYMTGPGGSACVFDPAVYYGHREMDLGMSKLFGGFDREFYEGYNAQWALEKGWEQRVDICNLYPLLVHVNLFGGGYVQDVTAIVSRFR